MAKKTAQSELIRHFFIQNPNRDIPHPEAVDWATAEYERLTGEKFRDPDRAIRKLSEQGFLVKVSKGIYRHEPDTAHKRYLEDLTEVQKKKILERDGYKCVICGKGKRDGVELHVDHIKPKDLGGKAILENGQVLCGKHNYMKKNLKQTETGKKCLLRFTNLQKVKTTKL